MGMHKEVTIKCGDRCYLIRVAWSAKPSDYVEMEAELRELVEELGLQGMREQFNRLVDECDPENPTLDKGVVVNDYNDDGEPIFEPLPSPAFPLYHAYRASGFLTEFFHAGHILSPVGRGHRSADYEYTVDLDQGLFYFGDDPSKVYDNFPLVQF